MYRIYLDITPSWDIIVESMGSGSERAERARWHQEKARARLARACRSTRLMRR